MESAPVATSQEEDGSVINFLGFLTLPGLRRAWVRFIKRGDDTRADAVAEAADDHRKANRKNKN